MKKESQWAEQNRRYYERNRMAFSMYQLLRYYAFHGERTGRKLLSEEEREARRIAKYRASNKAVSDRRRTKREQMSSRLRLCFAPIWPVLVGLIAQAYRDELDFHNARKRRQKAVKPEHYRAYQKQYAEQNREHLRKLTADWAKRTQYNKRRNAADAANVSNRYVLKKLTQDTALRAKDIPPALIEAKREQLLLHRVIQQTISIAS